MPVSGGMTPLSPTASDLGLGDALMSQVRDETDDERKKRLQQRKVQALAGPAAQMLGLTGGLGGSRP